MAKVSYTKLNLKTNSEVKTFTFNEQTVEVLKYLSVADKNDLVEIVLQEAEQDGIYNEVMIDMYFHLYLVYLYTNISFTEKQRENEYKLYDAMITSGFMKSFLETIEHSEYTELLDLVERTKEYRLKYTTTAASVIKSLIEDLPKNAEAASKIINTFDKEKFQEVVNFAKAVQ